MNLKELQEEFSASLITSSEKSFAWISSHTHLTPEVQIGIYRNSILGRVIKVLSATFPVCLALVGESCFRMISKTLIESLPTHFPEIDFFAKQFPLFVKDLKVVQDLVYLSDVAQLEWTYHRLHYHFATTTLDLEALSQVEESKYGGLRFELSQNCTLLDSCYPILRIWEVNQLHFQGSQIVHLDEGGCELLIYRTQEEVKIERLTAEMFSMLDLFQQKKSFEWICDKMATDYPNVDISLLFKQAILQGWIAGFK